MIKSIIQEQFESILCNLNRKYFILHPTKPLEKRGSDFCIQGVDEKITIHCHRHSQEFIEHVFLLRGLVWENLQLK